MISPESNCNEMTSLIKYWSTFKMPATYLEDQNLIIMLLLVCSFLASIYWKSYKDSQLKIYDN